MQLQSVYDLVAKDFDAVNELILEQLQSPIARVEDISQYLVSSGGKRIRPLVTLLAAGALGDYGNSRQIQLATAIEFLHTATLLHDDVVDMSTLRRGKATANTHWDNASSVLVGDFVYSRAFQLIVAVGSLPVMKILSDTTAVIAEGEVQQLSEVGNLLLNQTTYFEVIQRKTAELFAGACESAAVVANADAKTTQHMRAFGNHLGLAFQLVDDYLDYSGDTEKLGKNVGDDLAEGKLTLPLIRALEITAEQNIDDHEQLKTIISDKNRNQIEDVLRIVHNTGALGYTLEHAIEQRDLALNNLSQLSANAFTEAMSQLTQYVTERAS
jgi:octaprenyl-diphosphate synthase